MPSRRFPPPWSADEADSNLDRRSFIVRDASGQALAYVFFEGELGGALPRRGLLGLVIGRLILLVFDRQPKQPDR